MLKQYETVFILNPVLSETQVKDAVDKFRSVLTNGGAELVNDEQWGLRKLAYPIQHKTTGFYILFEYIAPTHLVNTLEVEFRRDETVMRFLTVALDKHGIEFNQRRKKGDFNKKDKEVKEEQA
jgi:small subunit ribosomal protein S6